MGRCRREIPQLLLVAGLTVVWLGAVAAPAAAKMPPFDLEVIPERSAAGVMVTVRVTIYQYGTESVRPIYEHGGRGEVMRDFPGGPLRNLVGVYPSRALDEQGWNPRMEHDLLTLYGVAPGVFEATFRAPDEGSVVVAPFPGVMGYDPVEGERLGYPAPVTVTVGTSSSPSPWWLVAPLLAVTLGALTVRRVRPFA